jgi:hypothetical protein
MGVGMHALIAIPFEQPGPFSSPGALCREVGVIALPTCDLEYSPRHFFFRLKQS